MKTLATLLFIITCLSGYAQQYSHYFDKDTIPGREGIHFILDTTAANVWQIGKPSKTIFDSAATLPNALMTDTLNTYPGNSNSSFILTYHTADFTGGITALQWVQKLDLEYKKDGGIIELSLDTGQSWKNVFTDPNIYNFYGFDTNNVDTLPNGQVGFTGTDSTWKNVWLCFDSYWLNQATDSMLVRYTLVSDGNDTKQEGWMIDNYLAHITWIHTITEEEQKAYLKVFPNPTNGRVYIKAKRMEGEHIIEEMQLINQQGAIVQEFGMSPTKFFIDIGHHPAGMYKLRVKTNKRVELVDISLQPE